MSNYETIECQIGEISGYLDDYDIEVESPDGWVRVSDFVDKGEWDEYVLSIDGVGRVRCNENHLFETSSGWKYAKDLVDSSETFLTDKGFETGIIRKTGELIPIVDIQVRHKNQRYYTNGVSSHNTAVGKSMAMCHLASDDLTMGRNVLYITMEMAEESIAERIDANLLDTVCDDIANLTHESFTSKIAALKSKTQGRLMIKEYPTASAHCGHFRALLTELRMKKNFVPDIIYIDYLNICASSRIKGLSGSVNTYSLVKSIAEEIRGLAVEFNVPIWSATQVTRAGFNDSDIGLTDTSESWGLPGTADLMIALISTEQLEGMGQLMVKQLKNRYHNSNTHKRFMVGIDRAKMRMYDIDDPTANLMASSSGPPPPVQSSPFATGMAAKTSASKFNNFKV